MPARLLPKEHEDMIRQAVRSVMTGEALPTTIGQAVAVLRAVASSGAEHIGPGGA